MKKIFPALALAAALAFSGPAGGAARESSPLSTVQLEKLVKRIENKGHNAQLTAPVASALGLGDGTTALVKSINNYNPGTGKHYTFGIVVGAGYYLATLSDGSSPHIFLFDRDLKTVKALKTGFGLEPMTPAEAAIEARETLEEFSVFIQFN